MLTHHIITKLSLLLFHQVVLLAISITFLPTPLNAENSLNPPHHVLQSASELDHPPFAIVNSDGTADGFSVELLKEVCAAVGLKIKFEVAPWHKIKLALKNGEIDVLPFVAYSIERDHYFDFTAPYLRMRGTIFTRKDETSILEENDLLHKEVAVMRSGIAHEHIEKKKLYGKLILTDTFADALTNLSNGKYDAVVMQKLVGHQLVNELGLTNLVDVGMSRDKSIKIHRNPLSVLEKKFSFAVQEGDKKVLALLNEGLALVIADGTYNELYDKWFGPVLPTPSIPPEEIAKYVAISLAPIAIFLIAAWGWSLRKEVQRQTKALRSEVTERKRAEEAAEFANRSKSQFLANMSHEIRTPMNGILGIMQILKYTPLTEDQTKLLDSGLTAGMNLTRLLNDILDLSKVEAGQLELSINVFDPSSLLNTMIEIHKPLARNKNINLYYTLDKGIPNAVLGDEGQYRQILFNLIGNAVKFTEQGEVHIHMKSEPTGVGQINLICSVKDTGIGIPDEHLESIFEPFKQVDGTYTRKFGGTGLGLSIVHRLAKLMDGKLHVESVVGVGTTFRVSIPLKIAEGETVVETTQSDAIAPTETQESSLSLHILLAEDDLSNQLVAKRMLEMQGHTVTCVGTGKEALAALDKEPFDLIFMDVQMPEMDGTEATVEIRKDDRFRDLPIIALTAHAMSGDKERFLEIGMTDYIAKPVSVEELEKVLARAMGKQGGSV